MKKVLLVLTTVTLLMATVGFAREMEFHVDSQELTQSSIRYDGDCVIGSQDFPGYQGYYSDWWAAGDAYAILVDYANEDCICELGIKVEAIHMFIHANQFCSFTVRAELVEAVDYLGSYIPGGPLAYSDIMTFDSFPGEGNYDLEVPITASCVDINRPLFLVFRYMPQSMGSFVGIPVDNTPTAEYGFCDWGIGWHDTVVQHGWVGDFYVWADVNCCDDPITNEMNSWGAIKQLFN
ncbi:hypothetical protein HOD41_01530 [bacterium]|nr:hypothetical protein [bacterium]